MLPPAPLPRLTTAIPPRYVTAREGVLRILRRWEASTRLAATGAAWPRAGTEVPCGS